MITAAHHPGSLTEEQRMRNRHEGIEARSHEVVSKAARHQVPDDASALAPSPPGPHSLPACLRAYVPSFQCPKMSPNVPIYRIHFARMRPGASWRTIHRARGKTNPPPLASLASWRSAFRPRRKLQNEQDKALAILAVATQPLPPQNPSFRRRPSQNKPTKPHPSPLPPSLRCAAAPPHPPSRRSTMTKSPQFRPSRFAPKVAIIAS
jgi:hypothetical protein